jgi:hypothetical protein
MKIIFLILQLSVFILFDARSQSNSPEKEFRTNVKSIEEFEFTAVQYFDSVIKGDLISKSIEKYQNDGGYEIIHYDSVDSITFKYSYNKSIDELILFNRFIDLPGILDSTKHIRYKRDNNNRVIEANTYLPEGRLVYKSTMRRDKNGNIIEMISYNADGSIMKKSIVKNIENGKKIEYSYIQKNDSLQLETTSIMIYDLKGNLTEETHYHGETKNIIYKRLKEYNKFGDIIEEEFQSSFVNYKYRYKLKYDSIGNWIEKICFEGFVPTEYTERNIKYLN